MLKCLKCNQKIHQRKLCYEHWKEFRSSRYHCTWYNCTNPIFSLTLCRHHYHTANVKCIVPECSRPSFCRQVCKYHYRKKIWPTPLKCSDCEQNAYMNGKCFLHFIRRNCLECEKTSFAKQLCRRHYMRNWRNQRRRGAKTNIERVPAIENMVPATTNHNPEIQSSG